MESKCFFFSWLTLSCSEIPRIEEFSDRIDDFFEVSMIQLVARFW